MQFSLWVDLSIVETIMEREERDGLNDKCMHCSYTIEMTTKFTSDNH